MSKSIPRKDSDFYENLTRVVEWLLEVMDEKGYDKKWIRGKLVPAYKVFKKNYLRSLDRMKRSPEVTISKNAARREVEILYSIAVKMIKGNAETTDAERITLGIPPNDPGYHRRKPVTNTAPEVTHDASKPMNIQLFFKEVGVERKGMPAGAEMVEVRWAILPYIPENESELVNVLFVTKGTAKIECEETDRGKWVRLKARWISPSGEAGLWTLTISIMVP